MPNISKSFNFDVCLRRLYTPGLCAQQEANDQRWLHMGKDEGAIVIQMKIYWNWCVPYRLRVLGAE